MDREIRNLMRNKQGRGLIAKGVPSVTDMEEGISVIALSGEGLKEYIKYNGALYENAFKKSSGKRLAGDIDVVLRGEAPNSNSSPGNTGEIMWDGTYFYLCVARDSWIRTNGSSGWGTSW